MLEEKLSAKFYKLPSNISFILEKNDLKLKGPLGSVSILSYKKKINKIYKNKIFFEKRYEFELTKYFNKLIKGISRGFKVELELLGIGYKVQQESNKLILDLGFSHLIYLDIPKNIEIFLETNKTIILYCIDYEMLNNFAHKIIRLKPMNRFTGQGIKFKKDLFVVQKNKKN